MKVLFVNRMSSLKRAYTGDLLTRSLFEDFAESGIDSRIIGLHNVGPRFLGLVPHSPAAPFSLNKVRRLVSNFNPDFIFTCFQNDEILKLGPKVIHWNIEWRVEGSEDRFSEHFESGCEYVFSAVPNGHEFLPLAASLRTFHPVRGGKKYPASFAGSYYAEREEGFQLMLYPLGDRAHIWGRDWKGHEDGMQLHGYADPDRLPGLYSESEVNINVHHPEVAGRGGFNSRTFEVLACGAFLATDYVRGMERFFDIGRELVVVREGDSVSEMLERFMNDDEKRQEIAQAGRRRVLAEHTTMHRAKRIMEVMGKL